MSQANNTYSRIQESQIVENVIHSDGVSEWVTVYFKEAYTLSTIYYNIPIKWTIDTVINVVKEWIIEDFDLRRRYCDNNNHYSINIIEMGQEIPETKPEEALCVEEEDITYYNKYIANNKWPGFYIKIISV